MSVAQKGDSGLNYVSEWNDRLEKKVGSMEASILSMGREQMRDKETIARLEDVNARMNEDFKTLLTGMHNDYQQRLDNRVTEIVNRIILEHEDRMRSHEDLRLNFEMREKLAVEKANYEREELRD